MQKEAEIRDRILNGTQQLFFRYGVKSITMDDIARELGISKKTIYKYFVDKNDLVLNFSRMQMLCERVEIEQAMEGSRNAIEEIMQSVKIMQKLFTRISPSTIYDLMKYHPDAFDEFRTFKQNHLTQIVEKNLLRGIREGLYREDINTKILSRLRVEEIEWTLDYEKLGIEMHQIPQAHTILLEHFLYGLCTLKGHKLFDKYKQTHDHE